VFVAGATRDTGAGLGDDEVVVFAASVDALLAGACGDALGQPPDARVALAGTRFAVDVDVLRVDAGASGRAIR
jgi:hypothetical protein